jgi:ADP-heptose:LPS heptosyltransferase
MNMERAPLGTPRRLAILRALQLGDLLCAVPALRALRRAFPATEITLIGLPWAQAFATRFAHLVDRFVEFPGYPGLPEREADLEAWPAFLQAARACDYDVALQLHGRGDITNGIVAAVGARLTAGFHARGTPNPDPLRYVAWPENGHEIHRLLALIDHLAIPRAGVDLEFPILPEDDAHAARLRGAFVLERGAYAIVHPGARLQSRRWPPHRFAAVAAALAAQGLRTAVTGSREELALTAQVARAVPGAVDLGGRTQLGTLAALVRDARVVVCNDTGISHVAAAVRTPSVVVSCGADPARFAPLDHARHEVLFHPIDCRPCAHDRCPIGHPCAQAIAPQRVATHALARIATRRGPAAVAIR